MFSSNGRAVGNKMAYDVENIVSSVRKRAKDDTLSESLLIEFINSVHSDVLTRSRWRFMEEVEDDTLSTGSNEYELSDEVNTIISMSLTNSSNSVWQPTYRLYTDFFANGGPHSNTQRGMPHSYTVFGRTIYFDCPAEQAFKLNVLYTKEPTVLTELADIPDVPEQYKEVLVLGALAMVERYRGNFDIASVFDRQVEDKLDGMLRNLTVRDLSRLPRAKFGGR